MTINQNTPVQSAVTDKLTADERQELETRYKLLSEKMVTINKKRESLMREATLIDFRLRKS